MQIYFFLKQRLKLKCLQSGNHPRFEHLPGTISTLKKHQSFFQPTFQDIDFVFLFSNIAATPTKEGKWVFLHRGGNPRGGKLDLHKLSFEMKICPFRINEQSDKTREQIYRGETSIPQLAAPKLWGRMQKSPPAPTRWEVRLQARWGPFWP